MKWISQLFFVFVIMSSCKSQKINDFSTSSIDQSQFNSENRIIETAEFLKTLRLLEKGKKIPNDELGKMYFKIEN